MASDRCLETYLREIDEVPLLSAQEEVELGRRVQKGDEAAREHMIRANLRLVVSVAKRFRNRGLLLQDLIAEGNIGLMKAIEKFDPEAGFRFSTYATWWIQQTIRRGLINTVKTVRIPSYMVEILTKWGRASTALGQSLGRQPSTEEIAKHLGLSQKNRRVIEQTLNTNQGTTDLTEDAVVHRAGVFSVADPFARLPQSLPPGETKVTYDTFCPPGCTKRFETPMNVFASMTHAHLRARRVVTSVGTPDGTGAVPDEGWRSVVNDDGSGTATGHFSHEDQKFVPVDFTVKAGDSLKTSCVYDTSADDAPIPFGPSTQDEMCMQVFLYWPKQYTFLCGYYGDQAYWCGDAGMFVPKDGSDRQYHSEACHVEAGQSCDDRNKELGFPLKDAPDKGEPITFLTR